MSDCGRLCRAAPEPDKSWLSLGMRSSQRPGSGQVRVQRVASCLVWLHRRILVGEQSICCVEELEFYP